MNKTNRHANYYAPYGSYDGAIKIKGRWIRANGLNYVNKTGWIRWQGPPSEAIIRILNEGLVFTALELFPERRRVIIIGEDS